LSQCNLRDLFDSQQFVDTQDNGNGNTSLVSKQFFNSTSDVTLQTVT